MKKLNRFKIGCLGFGNMGAAVISGLTEKVSPAKISIFDLNKSRLKVAKQIGLKTIPNLKTLVENSDLILIAVKPKDFKTILPELKDFLTNQILVSVAAGIKISYIKKFTPKQVSIFRVMPNTPALVKESMSVISPARNALPKDIKIVTEIFSLIGQTMILPEKKLDAVTALSGSGPAYVLTMIKAMTGGGIKMGLPPQKALALATQTVLGAAKLLADSSQKPEILIDQVTSPGGTTLEGLKVLDQGKFSDIVEKAIKAATKRSIELGKNS